MEMKVHYHGLYETNPQRGKGTRLSVADGKVKTMASFFFFIGFLIILEGKKQENHGGSNWAIHRSKGLIQRE